MVVYCKAFWILVCFNLLFLVFRGWSESQHDGKGISNPQISNDVVGDVRIRDAFAIMLALGSAPEISMR